MEILVNLDVMMAKRKISGGELAEKIGITPANLSILKTGKAMIALTGVSADVSPVESIELDLGRGAEVSFSGDPVVNLVKIQSASVLRKQ